MAVDPRREHVDWVAIERSPEFRELVARRRRFVVPATIFFLGWFLGFIVLAGYAPDFMGRSIYEGFTVGYGLALTQFLMVWGLTWLYLRKADRVFDPLRERAVERVLHAAETTGPAEPAAKRTGRFERPAADPLPREEVSR